jgi:YspA, cpYpsA-related SLOG family
VIIAVTGGRRYENARAVFDTLGAIHSRRPITLLVHGNCPTGADALSVEWANAAGVDHTGDRYSADWHRYGLSAGPVRNRLMLKNERPCGLVAFPGGSGTRNCVKTARELGIPVKGITG